VTGTISPTPSTNVCTKPKTATGQGSITAINGSVVTYTNSKGVSYRLTTDLRYPIERLQPNSER
jgi:hypothetical protein